MSDKERPFSGTYTDLASFRMNAIDTIEDLCVKHDITVEGIVALVDEVFSPDMDDTTTPMPLKRVAHVARLRRLARGEEA